MDTGKNTISWTAVNRISVSITLSQMGDRALNILNVELKDKANKSLGSLNLVARNQKEAPMVLAGQEAKMACLKQLDQTYFPAEGTLPEQVVRSIMFPFLMVGHALEKYLGSCSALEFNGLYQSQDESFTVKYQKYAGYKAFAEFQQGVFRSMFASHGCAPVGASADSPEKGFNKVIIR